MSTLGNYYEILEITSDAGESEIKKAYKKLALKFHPDKNPSPEASEKFKEISRAYEILSDPEKRHMYDLRGSEDQQSGLYDDSFESFHFHSPEEIFAQFFGSFHPFAFAGFSDPFGPSHRMHQSSSRSMFSSHFDDPFFSGGMTRMGGYGQTQFMDPFSSFQSFSSSSSPMGMGMGMSQSVSTTTRVVNGRQETVTVTKTTDQNGVRVVEDYGSGRQRITVNGVEEHNTLQSGSNNPARIAASESAHPPQYQHQYAQQYQQQQQQQQQRQQQFFHPGMYNPQHHYYP